MLATWFINNAFYSPRAPFLATAVLVVFGLSAVLVDSAAAIVVVNDSWKDGTDNDPTAANGYSENKVDVDADGDIESFWTQGGVGSLDPVGANGPLRGDLTAGGTSSASWTTYFTPEGSEVNLAAAGDKIKVTWAFTLTGLGTDNTSQNFRMGLADASDGARQTGNGSLTQSAWRGYAIWSNMGATLGNSNPFQLRKRTLEAAGNFLNTTSDFSTVMGNGATNGAHGYDVATPYTLTWEITRNASHGLDQIVTMSGGTLDTDGKAEVIATDATPTDPGNFGSYKFDTFGIRPSGATTTAQIFDTSMFKVEFLSSSTPVLFGDYNNNGSVDAADYVLWKNGGPLLNDPTPESVSPADYTFWVENFGKSLGGAGADTLAGSLTVPEPATWLLALAALCLWSGCRGGRVN